MPRPALLLGGACAIAAVIVAATLLLAPGETPPEEAPAPVPARPAAAPPAAVRPSAAPRADLEEGAAKSLYEAASTPAAFRDVWLKYPKTSWGKLAGEKVRALDDAARTESDRGLEELRRRAAGLGAADAAALWRAYAGKAPPDAAAKAEAAAIEIENRDRAGYNETVARARELAGRRAYAEAAELFDALGRGATEEVAARCAASAAQLRKAAADDAAAREAAARETALQAAREQAAPKALAELKARRYDAAIEALSGPAPIEADLARERAAVARAASFWRRFLDAARARAGQDVSLLFAGGKRLAGRLEAVQGNRGTLRLPEGPIDIPLDQVALDQVAAWTVGKAPDGAACLDAAMFFFAEGRDDLCSTYLATAKEKGADAEEVERVWREGLLRAALWAAAQPKEKK